MFAAPQIVPAPPITSDASSIESLPVKIRKRGRSRVATHTFSKYSKSRLESLMPAIVPSLASAATVAGSVITFVNWGML